MAPRFLSADNMFREWMVDVKPQVKEGVNELRILFRSPIIEGLKKIRRQWLRDSGFG